MRNTIYQLIFILSISVVFSQAQVPYETMPGWFSIEDDLYGTGCAIDDINGDYFPDLAISNGNDMLQAPNLAYINSDGMMPEMAYWVSSNTDYSGHCDLGDFDSDGYPELAVANYISSGWEPGLLNVYDNVEGDLDLAPSWISSDSVHSFRLAWGDADGDGDLDLAVATGEAYYAVFEPNLIFYNINGLLQAVPGWESSDRDACYDVKWVDVDSDGDLDLAFCESGGPINVYYNYGDSISTTSGWQSAEDDNYNSMDFADIDGDGYPELAVAANIQQGGSGLFKIYNNIDGTLDTAPAWTSVTSGYGSEAALSDVDDDGDFDLVCGRWWGLVQIYLNNDGVYESYPEWSSSDSYSSVIENIAFGDFNRGGERHYREASLSQSRLIYLPYRQIAGVDSVRVDGWILNPESYCHSLWDGWVSLGVAVSDSAEIFYRYSITKDLAVSNWDRETFIFYNTSLGFIAGDANDSGALNGLDVVFLVAYLKGIGPMPEPLLAADANGSCDVNGLDVTFLVNYFKGGPAPFAGNCD